MYGKGGDSTVGRRPELMRTAWLTLKWRMMVMPANVGTNTTREKYRQRRSMTQHHPEGQAVNLWSIQVLLVVGPRV